jgi:hypothetical protein
LSIFIISREKVNQVLQKYTLTYWIRLQE